MEIKLDDKYTLFTDNFCSWIMRTAFTKKGTTRQTKASGYCATLEDTLASFLDKKILSSKAESLEQILKEIQEAKEEIHSWFKNIEKGVKKESATKQQKTKNKSKK